MICGIHGGGWSAALNISARRASSPEMFLARSLQERCPGSMRCFGWGIRARLVATISWRTHLVIDAQAMAAIDAGIAGAAERWGSALSDAKVDAAIDALVKRSMIRRPGSGSRRPSRGLDVQFNPPDDATGVFGCGAGC